MEYGSYLQTVKDLEPTEEMLRQREEAWRQEVEAERREVQVSSLEAGLGAKARCAAALA